MKTLFLPQRGFTLLELMVAIALSTFIVALVLTVYFKQHNFVTHESQRQATVYEARLAYTLLDRLLKQAESNSLSVSYPQSGTLNGADVPQVDNDTVVVEFTLPAGYPIWPNDTAPFTQNAVRLSWTNAPGESQHVVSYAVAADITALGSAVPFPLFADAGRFSPRIINLDLWPLKDDGVTPQTAKDDDAAGGYLLSVAVRSGSADGTYNNPAFADDHPLRHYYVYTISSAVSPRN